MRTKAELLLLSCTFIWGGTFVVVKGGLEDASPLLFIAVRFLIATVLFVPLGFSRIKTMDRRSFLDGAVLGILLFVGLAAQTAGLQYTTASKSGFITGLLVAFTPVFQLLIERRPPKAGNLAGVFFVLVGLYFLTSPEGSSFNIGDGLTLISAALFGLYIVYLDVFSKRSDFSQLTFVQFFLTSLLALVLSPFLEQPRLALSFAFLGALAYLSLLATLFTLFIQTKYQRFTTPTRAGIIFSVEPVWAATIAYFALGEMIGMLGVIGGGLIVAGLLISELSDVIFPSGEDNEG